MKTIRIDSRDKGYAMVQDRQLQIFWNDSLKFEYIVMDNIKYRLKY